MYPSIPITEAIEIIEDHLGDNKIHADVVDDIVFLLKVCLKDNM